MWPAPVELWGPGSREVVGEDLGPRVREALAWPSRVSTLRVQFAPLFFILMRVERSRRRSWSSRVALVEGGSTAAILAVILPETSSWKAAGPVEREEGESSCRSAGWCFLFQCSPLLGVFINNKSGSLDFFKA